MRKIIKWIIAAGVIAMLSYFAYAIFGLFCFLDAFDSNYSKKDLIDNYNSKAKEITELKNYIQAVTPINRSVEIEFDNNHTLGIFHVAENNTWDSNWNIKVGSEKASALLHKLGWTEETLSILKNKMDDANCISAESGEPCTIGFQRSGMGKYYYKIFDHNLNDSLINLYNDSCQYIFYKNNIVLEYGGGVRGSQCFEREVKEAREIKEIN